MYGILGINGEQAALRALRRKGIVAPSGLHLTNAYRAETFLQRAELAQVGQS